jgi:hypothetical protein
MSNAKAECEKLMNAALPFADQMLREHGEFFPFGGALNESGEIESIAAVDDSDRPASSELLGRLRSALAQAAKSGKYRATAVVYDVRVSRPPDGKLSEAVAVELDHRDDLSLVLFVPYQRVDGQVEFGELFAQQGEGRVFAGV